MLNVELILIPFLIFSLNIVNFMYYIKNCNSRVEVKEWYLDDTNIGAGRSKASVWSYSYIKDLSRWTELIVLNETSIPSEQIPNWTEF